MNPINTYRRKGTACSCRRHRDPLTQVLKRPEEGGDIVKRETLPWTERLARQESALCGKRREHKD